MKDWLIKYKLDIIITIVLILIGFAVIHYQPKGTYWHMLVLVLIWIVQYVLKAKREKKNK